MRRQWPLVR